ncbi:MAG: serine/threonine-protein kinase [Anaerostipes faecalis]|nr:serine/threonine-protein kinase [Anaerostipes faecalis]
MDEALFYEEQYQVIKPWGHTKNTFLVKDTFQNCLAVQKILPESMQAVVEKIQEIHCINIAKIRDYFIKDGKIYIYQEYVSGQLLSEKINQEGTIPLETAVSYLKQLCTGVHQLHQQGIVHRNLTPDHLMITDEGILKIVDFNISREIKEESTKDTQLMGTPGYAAPEQFGFEQSTGKADIYAMGVLLNVMLTEKFPSEKLYDGSKKIQRMIQTCIAVDEKNRYADVLQMKKDLERSSQAYYIRKLIQEIPGLRSEKKSGFVIACIGYPIYIFWGYLVFLMSENVIQKIFHIIFLFCLPFVIMTDLGSVMERMFHWKIPEKMRMNYSLRILLCGVIFFFYLLVMFVSELFVTNGFR